MKPGLQSKRQQSEPPLNRNVFPPTPPPESEKTQAPSQMSRGASVRNGPKPMPAKLNIEKARPNERYEVKERIGTSRTASEPRGPPSRQYAPRSGSRPPPQRRPSEEEEDDYPGELYDMYSEPGSQGVAEPMGDVNHNTSKKRKNTPAITMMDPLMKGNSKWFQIDHLHYGPEHPQRLAAAASHGGPR